MCCQTLTAHEAFGKAQKRHAAIEWPSARPALRPSDDSVFKQSLDTWCN